MPALLPLQGPQSSIRLLMSLAPPFGLGHPVVEVKEPFRQADAATGALEAGSVGALLDDGQVFDLLLRPGPVYAGGPDTRMSYSAQR